MRKRAIATTLLLAVLSITSVLLMSGCNANAWMGDPAAAGYYKPTPTTIPILDRIDIIEEPLQRGELSRVTAEDLMPVDLTYRIAPGDTVTADIYGLYNSQQIHPVIRRVDQSGYFRVPEVGDVLAAGLTQQEFQDTLVEELGKVLMTHPSVQVSMADSTAFTYTMYGELQRWGVFTLTQPNLRLVDALALAGGVPQTTKKIYVIRQLALHDQVTPSWETDHGHKNAETRTPKNPDFHQGSSAPKNTETNLSIEDLIKQLDIGADASSPQSNAPDPSSDAPLDPPPVVPHNELEQKDSTGGNSGSEQPLDVSDLLVDTDQSDPTPAPTSGETELQSVSPGILLGDPDELLDVDDLIPTRASKKPPVDIDHLMGPSSRIPDAAPAFIYVPERDEWIAVDSGGDKSKKKHADVASPDTDTAVPEVILERIIEIPWKRLKNGDSSYNIVVRPDDRIYVASSPMGNVYLRGAVARPGVFQLPATGGLTLARMIAAAGGLGPTAKPEKVSLTRRIGDNLEATVTLNLAAIMQKTEPDIFLRADDLISVGTDWGSTPMAIIRNGFRTSYGFGFLLDRNFGNDVFGAPPRSGF